MGGGSLFLSDHLTLFESALSLSGAPMKGFRVYSDTIDVLTGREHHISVGNGMEE